MMHLNTPLSRSLMLTALLGLSALTVAATAATSDDENAVAIGDLQNGAKLWKKASKKAVKVDGNWANKYSNATMKKALTSGKGGFPKIKSDNALDLYDVIALIRSKNTYLDVLVPEASHMLLGKGVLDEYAEKRLADAKVTVGKADKKRRVFALFSLKDRAVHAALKRVKPKNSRMRDKLTPKKGVAYAVFVKLDGFRDGSYEAGFIVDRDIKIQHVSIRDKDGNEPADLNRAAARLKGRGDRGKYQALKLPGRGKAIKELSKPLSAAFLRGMESVYMYEVGEREHFEFFEE